MANLQFNLVGHGPISIDVQQLVIAGWTGRDHASVEHHIQELEAIGVKRPASIPSFYRVSADLLTISPSLQVAGDESSGEAEFVLFSTTEGLLVGIGSDHTDRKVESYGVTVSKQMCAKPVGADLWRMSELAEHWDELQMRTWRRRGAEHRLYQEGAVTKMLAPQDLIGRYTGGKELPVGTVMFCGTQPIIGEMGFGECFEMELSDPRLQRSLTHRYNVVSLPIEG
ncbi:hypothetical protein CAter282_2177 [Collimonas arenae]|uniref:DUF2848 domain-containing protein n=1 Tax=Collimonas arenae TaxID=279058 RepID=A0A127QIN7_9BURK|nr:DUF2848 domain-containing protein [Collimonas arenae]AMP09931.1 hypothetical protein CAter282_2177 [Collimonas arenae]